jgi:hypothetical protein
MDQAWVGGEVYFVAHEDDKQVWLMPHCRFKWQNPIPPKRCRDEFVGKLSDAETSGSLKKLAEVLEEGKRKRVLVHWQSTGGINGRGVVRAGIVKPTPRPKDDVTRRPRTGASPQFVIEDDYEESECS